MEITTHPGTIIASGQGRVTVQMKVTSACSSCQAHAHCTFSESKDKNVEIDTPDWKNYAPGDSVTVIINSSRGLLAVFLAYVLPSIVILATFALLYSLRLPEIWVALATLLAVALYCGILYLCRNRLQRKFTFNLRKNNPA